MLLEHRVEESLLNECTDVTTIEELVVNGWRWVESGVLEEHCIEILPIEES